MAPNHVSENSVDPKSTIDKGGNMTDLAERFNKNIRPLLDAVDRLRSLKVMNEGIPLPSIVVVGDQSSGKSSVLESLATISLPRGQGIATRVPLVLRLQSCQSYEDSSITISYKDTQLSITEDEIESHVNAATNVLAGTGKGVVTDTVISLHIRKPDAPDLTMIDLPGITRVPVHGQPANIYEQIATMIRRYLKPQETVILNVLSATVDFSTCESIRMSQEEDKKGERTLAVVTKVDRAPNEVYEKVTADDVNIGLGYICVRNRTDDDQSHEEAREQERELFDNHPSLSQLEKSSVGIPSLAERLTMIQADIIRKNLPGIQQKIDKALVERQRELETIPAGLLDGEDPSKVFLNVLDENKDLVQDIIQNGNYDRVLDQKEMHYPARIDEMFQNFSDTLHKNLENILLETKTREIFQRMQETRGLSLPNFLSPTLMKSLVSEEIDNVSALCHDLVPQTHEYARKFIFDIIEKSTSSFPNLQHAYKQVADNVLGSSQSQCKKYVRRVLEKERSSVFTMNDYYMANVKKIREHVALYNSGRTAEYQSQIEGFRSTVNLQETRSNPSNEYQSAFDMKVNLAAYCKVVHKRMADEIPLDLRFSLETALQKDLRDALLKVHLGQDLSALMEENKSNLQKRQTLRKRVDILTECKELLQKLF